MAYMMPVKIEFNIQWRILLINKITAPLQIFTLFIQILCSLAIVIDHCV